MRQALAKILGWVWTLHAVFFAIAVALLGGVFWDRMTDPMGNAAAVAGAVAGVLAVWLFPPLARQSRWVRRVGAGVAAVVLAAFVYCWLWAFPDLQLAYRIESKVEKRTWRVGTEFQYKGLMIGMRIVNRSDRAMDVQVTLHGKYRQKDGTYYTLDIAGEWYETDERFHEPRHSAGANSVAIDDDGSVSGYLYFRLPSVSAYKNIPTGGEEPEWDAFPHKDSTFEFLDLVSDKSFAGPYQGFPEEFRLPYTEFTHPEKPKITYDPKRGHLFQVLVRPMGLEFLDDEDQPVYWEWKPSE